MVEKRRDVAGRKRSGLHTGELIRRVEKEVVKAAVMKSTWRKLKLHADTLPKFSHQRWEANLLALQTFVEENDGRYPVLSTSTRSSCVEEHHLLAWRDTQRRVRRGTLRGVLSAAQEQRLEKLRGWSWGGGKLARHVPAKKPAKVEKTEEAEEEEDDDDDDDDEEDEDEDEEDDDEEEEDDDEEEEEEEDESEDVEEQAQDMEGEAQRRAEPAATLPAAQMVQVVAERLF